MAACGPEADIDTNESSREELFSQQVPGTVFPLLDCVERRSDGSFAARFGYRSAAKRSIEIEVGPRNFFEPKPRDRGQVTVFKPGLTSNAFSVPFGTSSSLRWTIKNAGGITYAAVASHRSGRCTEPPDAGGEAGASDGGSGNGGAGGSSAGGTSGTSVGDAGESTGGIDGLCTHPSGIAQEIEPTPWQLHSGEGIVKFGFRAAQHGDPKEYEFARIPEATDPRWQSAPNPETIAYEARSTLCGRVECQKGADFTYFQTFVSLPANAVLDAFEVAVDRIDDGVRITLFNSAYPNGVVVPNDYASLGESATVDLTDFARAGEENRIVLTHVDDCCSESFLRRAHVVVRLEQEVLTEPLDDGNPCTSDSCDSVHGAIHAPFAAGTPCDDADLCNGREVCAADATCMPGTPGTCPPADTCHLPGSCHPQTGRCSTVPAADGTPCDDGSACTLDTCRGGVCESRAIFCPQIARTCHLGPHCDPERGPCEYDPLPDGTPCDDGNACNGAETCVAGECSAGNVPALDDGNPCTIDACDAVLGEIHTPVAAGTSCADTDVCDGDETCNDVGQCVAPTPAAGSPAGGTLNRTPWQMHESDGVVTFGFTSGSHGDVAEYDFATIPPATAAGWVSAPNGESIAFNPGSSLCGHGCRSAGRFTYFQSFVNVPAHVIVTTFTVAFSGIDDGVRTTVFNSVHPNGLVVPGSYVFLGGSGTANLAEFVRSGEVNRVVVTHVDDCCSGSSLSSAQVVLNGSGVATGPAGPSIDDQNPCTIDSCDPSSGIRHEPLPPGTSCADANHCNGEEVCDALARCVAPSTNLGRVEWVDWTSAGGTTALGTAGDVSISYDGELSPSPIVEGGENYWAFSSSTYTAPPEVENSPPTSDILRLTGGASDVRTIRFSQTVVNPVMGIVSLGAGSPAQFDFIDAPFRILNNGPGHWGNGPLTELSGDVLHGVEGHGIIQFEGAFDSISWTNPLAEFWYGFTIGVHGTMPISCDDGNACNGVETCDGAGTCLPGMPPVLDDGNICTADHCEPETGVRHDAVPNGTSCADANVCNGLETCQGGVCIAGEPPPLDGDGASMVVSFVDWSTIDTLGNTVRGTVRGIDVLIEGSDLDGGVSNESSTAFTSAAIYTPPLSVSDAVNFRGHPSGYSYTVTFSEPVTNPRLHLVSLASTLTFTGVSAEKLSGDATLAASGSTVSGERDDVTAPGYHSNGTVRLLGTVRSFSFVAVGPRTGPQLDLGDGISLQLGIETGGTQNPCSVTTCDPSRGISRIPLADGTSCADANVCNGDETCQAGICIAGTALLVDDGNACTTDSCDPVTGPIHAPVPDGTSCADADSCNGAELCSLGACTAACVPTSPSLIGWWPLDEESGTRAQDIVGGDDGTHRNGPVPTSGNVRGGLEFDGVNDSVSIDSVFPFHGEADATLEFWLNAPASGHQSVFWTRPDNTDANRYNLFVNADATFGFDYRDRTGALHLLVGACCTGISIPRNTWAHFAITREAHVYSLYLNGALATTAVDSAPNVPDAVGWQMAGRSLHLFDGALDEVKVHSRALTAAEVLANYLGGSSGNCDVRDCVPSEPVACTPPPSGMVGWWPGDGHAADIGGSSDAILQGGPTFAPGRVSQAFHLDGIDDFIDLGNAPPLHVSTGDFTVDAWVRFDALTQPPGGGDLVPGDMSIVDKMSAGGLNRDGWRILKQQDNRFWFCFGSGGANRCSDPAFTVFSTTRAEPDTWFHVAAVKRSASFSLYVNGVEEDVRPTLPSFLDTNSANLRIGSYALEGSHLNGLVDEVEIHRRVLTAQEIRAIYAAGAAGKCKDIQRNQPPLVEAGPDQNARVGEHIALAGSISDDQLPEGSVLESLWTLVSGAGEVTFADETAAVTTATFGAPGTYVLRLEATDGELSSSDDLEVRVAAANLVTVPNVVGLGLSRAEQRLISSELRVGTVSSTIDGTLAAVFDVLPSMRGWRYNAATTDSRVQLPEEAVFGVSGGLLLMDTMEDGFGGGCNNMYERTDAVRGDSAWTIRMRARVLEEDRLRADNSFGLALGADYPGSGCALAIGFNRIADASHRELLTDIDVTQFHDYEVECDAVTQTYRARVDGALIAEGEMRTDHALNRIYFGDGTCGANTRSEIASFSFEQAIVAHQAPPAEALVPPLTLVDLGLQSGPATAIVPDVQGAAREDAERALADAGLVLGRVVTRSSADVAAGHIVGQNPLPNSRAVPGERVELDVSNGPPSCVPAPPDLRAWWRADRTTTDELTGLTGVVNGGVSYAPGVAEQSWLISRGYIEVPHSPQFVFSDGLAIEAWLRPNAFSSTVYTKFNDNGGSPAGWTMSQSGDSERVVFSIAPPEGGNFVHISSPPGSVPLGRWTHVTVTVDATAIRLYVNGEQVGAERGIRVGTNTGTLAIGAYKRAGPERSFGGNIDDLSVYARALAPAEIRSLYNASIAGKCPVTPIQNEPPEITPLAPLAITLPATASLATSVSDDGLPAASTVSCSWEGRSGPGNVAFIPATGPATTAAFSVAGSYVVRLTCTDGALTSFIDVSVMVNPAAPGENQPPTVNAGPDRTVVVDEPVVLVGSFLDDGLPEGGLFTFVWGIVDGPARPRSDDFSKLTLDASFPDPGRYELALVVNDGALDGFDTVIVDVSPRPNQAPSVDAGPDQTIRLPATATLASVVTDDGLPPGAALIACWSVISGACSVPESERCSLTPTVTFPIAGSCVLRLTASDTQFSASDDVTVIALEPVPNQPPLVTITAPPEIQLPDTALLLGSVVDDGLPAGRELVVRWEQLSGPAPVAFDPIDAPITRASFTAAGHYALRLNAFDGERAAHADVEIMVWAPPGGPAPNVSIATPADSATVTELARVIGTANDTDLAFYTLSYRFIGIGEWIPFQRSTTPLIDAALGDLDPTLLENGLYELRLEATDLARQTASVTSTFSVEGSQKVGNFTVSFKDLSVPVAGIPIEVIRTYDSKKRYLGDFGVGWSLDIKTVRVQKNRVPARLWAGTVEPGPFGIPNFCIRPVRPHLITFSFADGKVFKFEVRVSPECQLGAELRTPAVTFVPHLGTTASLSLEGGNTVFASGPFDEAGGDIELLTDEFEGLLDPERFILTLHDGRELRVSSQTGLEQVRDTNGNLLEIRANGLFQTPSGSTAAEKSITFTRDTQGRITHITDPRDNALHYSYDGRGDLETFTDAIGNVSSYEYDARHLLIGIRDPRGIEPVRNEYDDAGRLIGHTDAFDETIRYAHDLVARRETVTDRLGNATVHEYDDRGNVLRTTDALGQITTYTYDERDNKLSECNALQECTTFEYDVLDNKTEECNHLVECTEFTYDSRGNVLTTTDALGRVTENRYDSRRNLEETEDADGNLTKYGYDARGLQISMTDAANQTTIFDYDASGNLIEEIDAAGRRTKYTYDDNGNRETQTTTRTTLAGLETLVTTFDYDELNRLIATTHPDGTTTEVEYNSIGQQSATIDQLHRRTERTYDELGRLIGVLYSDGTTETTGYDAEGRRTSSTDRAGRTTSFEYDDVGRLVRTNFPGGGFTLTAYDGAGRALSTTDETGATTSFGYDEAGRRVLTTDPLGAETSFTYDAVGNQLSMTDPLGHVTTYEYDDLNRRTGVIYVDTTTDQTEYDALGRRTAKVDQDGKRTEFGYDALGRLTSVTDAASGITQYGYDEAGNQVSQTDARGRVTRFAYDRMGRRVRRTLPAVPPSATGAFETMTYDDAGNQKTKTDFMGRTTEFDYDLNNRLMTKTYPDDSEVGFTYNDTGRRLTATDARGITSYDYDDRDRLTALTYPGGRRLEYGYDLRGVRTSLRAHVGGTELVTEYGYDDAGRLDAVTDPNGGDYSFDYDDAGRRTALSQPNGTVTTYTYDTLNRLTDLTTVHVPSATTIQSYAYTLGATGIRTRIDEAGGVAREYGYDTLYRLTNETVTGSATNYAKVFTYDAVGNRETQTTTGFGAATVGYTYDVRDRLLLENAIESTWDTNGNLTSRAGDATYSWDFDDRLVQVTKSDGTIVEHTYDVDGVRVRTRTASAAGAEEITEYLVDTAGALSHVVAETDGDGTLTAYYVRAGDRLLAVLRGTDARYYHADGLGSVRALTDASGSVTDGYGYTAFGEALGGTGSEEQPYRFAGEEWDQGTEAAYLRARWFSTRLGRMFSVDPASGIRTAPLSLHPYLYSAASPVSVVDPTGRTFLLVSMLPALATQGFVRRAEGVQKFALFQMARAQTAVMPALRSVAADLTRPKPVIDATTGQIDIQWEIDLGRATGGVPLPQLVLTCKNAWSSGVCSSLEIKYKFKGAAVTLGPLAGFEAKILEDMYAYLNLSGQATGSGSVRLGLQFQAELKTFGVKVKGPKVQVIVPDDLLQAFNDMQSLAGEWSTNLASGLPNAQSMMSAMAGTSVPFISPWR